MAIHDPVIYGPDVLILQDGGRVDRPPYECDVNTTRWKCKTSLIDRLLPKWGDKHPSYAQLRKTQHTFVSTRGGWTELDCTYRGVIGEMPKVKISPGQIIGNATIEKLGDDGEALNIPVQIEVQYYSPTTTYEYYSKAEPKGPIFKGRLKWFVDSLEIIGKYGAGRDRDNINIFSGKTLLAARADGKGSDTVINRPVSVKGAYNGTAEVVTSNYKAEPVAEGLWKCTETNQIQVIPFDATPAIRIS